jgi:hypothetical protein
MQGEPARAMRMEGKSLQRRFFSSTALWKRQRENFLRGWTFSSSIPPSCRANHPDTRSASRGMAAAKICRTALHASVTISIRWLL